MNTDVREKLIKALSGLSEQYPPLRFAQLVANVAYREKGPTDSAVWDVEDAELLAAAEQHLQQLTTSDSDSPSERTA